MEISLQINIYFTFSLAPAEKLTTISSIIKNHKLNIIIYKSRIKMKSYNPSKCHF